MKYFITKDQILEIYKYGCGYVCTKLEELYPSAFKKVFTVGSWYKIDKNIFCCTEITEMGTLYGYGIFDGIWKERFNNGGVFCACNSFASKERLTEATDEEVEEALITEAKKRGYKKGVRIIPVNEYNTKLTIASDIFKITEYGGLNVFNNDGSIQFEQNTYACLYASGKWAEIITEETKVITMDKAVKILSKKYGQKVEIK